MTNHTDPATTVLAKNRESSQPQNYVALSKASGVPASTLRDRDHGRISKESAESKQYLTPQEEITLKGYLLRMSKNGFPVPVRYLSLLAWEIVRRRSSALSAPSSDGEIRPPGKNWPQASYQRHPEVHARRLKAIDWRRHDHSIYDKVEEWFRVIQTELHHPAILAENVYNMDETGVLLSALGSLKVLVGKDDPSTHRGAAVKPQLAVCGDQSAGKSSVLEGITGIPFPRKEGVCTRHPTEIILRHGPHELQITASVIPHASHDKAKTESLRSYLRRLSGYHELPDVIEEVSRLMGLKGPEHPDGPLFAPDVLRIEVNGPTGLDLTIVDLPGLISGSEDADIVNRMVDAYLESPRTIILAVVPAAIDVETQAIVSKARHFDREGERTVGIITKPDLINVGTEGRVVSIVNNQGAIQFKLGFFLLKNPSPSELEEGISFEQRKRNELAFFTEDRWQSHRPNRERIGVDAIRTFLQSMLERHIEKELPKVRAEILALLKSLRKQVEELGQERPLVSDQRLFLSKLSMTVCGLIQSAVDGTYRDITSGFFAAEEDGRAHNKLRAQIHFLNSEFAIYIMEKSTKIAIRSAAEEDKPEESDNSDDADDKKDDPSKGKHLSHLGGPEYVSREDFDAWVMKVYHDTRGLELPGNYNHTFLSELFHEQSSRWADISETHTRVVHEKICSFVGRVLCHTINEEHLRDKLHRITRVALEQDLEMALEELRKICNDEKAQPLTYNHYYTDTVQRAREDSMRNEVKLAIDNISSEWGQMHISNTLSDRQRLLSALQTQIQVDMSLQACEEASTGLHTYYKVARETFVDNVARQVIERNMVKHLSTVFDPTVVLRLTDEEVQCIAGEPESKQERRKKLRNLVAILEESLKDLQN